MSVLLLSGGLDSAVCLALAPPDAALFVDYGQPHLQRERPAAEALARHYSVPLAVAKVWLPAWRAEAGDPRMYVPGRNLTLIALAAPLGSPVVMGCNADDRENYPDCRVEFFDALRPVVRVWAPLVDLTKPQIGQAAEDLGLDVSMTWSCYYPDQGESCGVCDACRGRGQALG